MQAVRIETKITDDGNLILNQLPFRPGDSVEVIVLERERRKYSGNRYPLRGSPVTYSDPFQPVSEASWEAFN